MRFVDVDRFDGFIYITWVCFQVAAFAFEMRH
jgi:hypothetical protein